MNLESDRQSASARNSLDQEDCKVRRHSAKNKEQKPQIALCFLDFAFLQILGPASEPSITAWRRGRISDPEAGTGHQTGQRESETSKPDQAVDNAADWRRLTASNSRDEIELKESPQSPVDGPDDCQDQRDSVQSFHLGRTPSEKNFESDLVIARITAILCKTFSFEVFLLKRTSSRQMESFMPSLSAQSELQTLRGRVALLEQQLTRTMPATP
jgi:hypothetical protein